MTEFIIFISITAVALFLIIFFVVFNSVRNNRVLKASPHIQKIEEINNEFVFKELSQTSEIKTFHLNSKRQYDTFDIYKKKIEYIRMNFSYFQRVTEKISYNILTYRKYQEALSHIPLTADAELAKNNKMSLKSFNKREEKLGNKLMQKPQMNYSLRINWEYTSPAGRNHYSNYRIISYEDIKLIVSQGQSGGRNDYIKTTPPKQTPTYNRPKQTPVYNQPKQPEKTYTNDDIEDIE